MKLLAYLLVVVACVGGLLFNKRHQQAIRELAWSSATGLVEEARPQIVGQGLSQGGGAMLYRVEILVRYSTGGQSRKQWTTISQLPQLLADASLQCYLLKGKRIVVRWRPDDSPHIEAEIN